MFQHRAGVVLLAALVSLILLWTGPVAGQGTPVLSLDETFEGTFPGAWQLYGDPTWQTDDFKPQAGAKSAWCARGGWMGVDPQFSNYADNMDAWMIYGPFSLENATSASFSFDLWLESELNYDYFHWGRLHECETFDGESISGTSGGWTHRTYDLSAALGEPYVCIAFGFTSDVSVTYKGAFVDNVRIEATVEPVEACCLPGEGCRNLAPTFCQTQGGTPQGAGTACGPDGDGDGYSEPCDNCPWVFNPDQTDGDSNGVGDACEASPDLNGDGQVDADDVWIFRMCALGPALPPDASCNPYARSADFDGDGDVDQSDFAVVQLNLGGPPGLPPWVPPGPTGGSSKITYTLELGGNNHATDWRLGERTLYTRGGADDGQLFDKDQLVNYAVVVKAEGVHSQPGHPADGFVIFGAANLVFDLELHEGSDAGPVVNGAVFRSTINDGAGSDPAENAAFALGFTVLPTPGRLIDKVTWGGPRMEPIFTYPSAAVAPGKLVGMGAGYMEWNRTGSNDVLTLPGVGMAPIPNGAGGYTAGLGEVPVFEGQIDMSALLPGTYVLKVIPSNGNTVLRGDLNLLAAVNRPAFAVPVNETIGDDIMFTIGSVDTDGDGVPDASDNCPAAANPDQTDADADGLGDACDVCLATIPGATVDANGCPPYIRFDFDRDGDVDGTDLEQFTSCTTGPGIAGPPEGCRTSFFSRCDLDGDVDVDQADFGAFQRCFSGLNLPADPGCESLKRGPA